MTVQQQHELVAAEASDGVGLGHSRRQSLRHDLQQPVADVVAQRVVDELESIEVDEYDGEPSAVARGGVDRLL
jgi:hypothetical protein